jgi:hypothetical protein
MVGFLKAIGGRRPPAMNHWPLHGRFFEGQRTALTVMFTDHSHEIERETNNPASAVVDAGDAEQAPPAYLALSLSLSQ